MNTVVIYSEITRFQLAILFTILIEINFRNEQGPVEMEQYYQQEEIAGAVYQVKQVATLPYYSMCFCFTSWLSQSLIIKVSTKSIYHY